MASEQLGTGLSNLAISNDDGERSTALLGHSVLQTQARTSIGATGSADHGGFLPPDSSLTSTGAANNGRQVNTPGYIPSPSVIDKGFGVLGYATSASNPEILRVSTGADQRAGAQPQRSRSGHSGRSQTADTFSVSAGGSSALSSENNSQHNRSHGRLAPFAHGVTHTSSLVGPEQYDANYGHGIRSRHALEAERDNVTSHLMSTLPHTVQPIGSQMRHLLDDERNRLVDTIPGAYVRDSHHLQASPDGRLQFRDVVAEERDVLIDQILGQSQEQRANKGFRARLLHAAGDFFQKTFPFFFHSDDSDDEKNEIKYEPHSVGARLSATLKDARSERNKYARKAALSRSSLNIAIALQVLLGSLTTGLSAVATQGKSAAVPTTILGALSTVVASFLASARSSNEPKLSITRVKELEQFIRECSNLMKDYGHDKSGACDDRIKQLRNKFENLLGNANGERKLSATGGALSK